MGSLMDNPHESLILVDREGVIRYISPAAAGFYETSPQEARGRHILDMNPDSQLPSVIETGKAEVGQVLKMGDRERIVARIPLRNPQGEVIGAMAKLVFWRPQKAKEIVRQLEVLEGRLDYYQKELRQLYSSRYSLDRLVGKSKPIEAAKELAARAAQSDLAVLITGETGTGKEVLAHAVHQMGRRKNRPFVRVNCAAIPGELFEAELFGYESGAFTGADRRGKPGRFELADGGTIFLDEVGDLPRPLQVKLLRVIQEREVERLGSTRVLKIDFRLIAATNQDLPDLVKRHDFREDLFYRLNIFPIRMPPLREIADDIPRLAHHFLSLIRAGNPKAPVRISPPAMAALKSYHWPGNVRQLHNALERAVAVAGQETLEVHHLPGEIIGPGADGPRSSVGMAPLKKQVAAAERR
ncbi:MAG: sigma 54-interacting transcriptional regulator, partial [Proteobacteria bacterium]|nr:sigma 54-interacting transcriptional regulator [Pseudomonadota bacterium]